MRTGFIAVKGVDKAQVLERLGEVEGSRPGRLFADPCVGVSQDGWVIVMKPDPEFPTPERLAAVSVGGEAVGYAACTVVMACSALGYRDGRQVWAVDHNGQRDEGGGPHHLVSSGDLPPAFDAIVAQARKEQAAEDEAGDPLPVDFLFDVPENVAFEVCGFHPKRDFDFDFTALARPEPAPRPPGLLARLGRG